MTANQIRMGQLACSDIYDEQVKHVPTLLVDSYSYARTLHEEFLEDGYEGSIIRLNWFIQTWQILRLNEI